MHFKRVNSNHLIEILLFQIDKDLQALKVLEITKIVIAGILTIVVMDAVMLTCRLIVLIAIIIVTTAVVMAVVAEMVAVAVAKVLINYYLQKHLES